MGTGNLSQLLSKFDLLRRDEVTTATPCVILIDCLGQRFHSRQVQHFSCVPACMVQAQEAHLVDVFIAEENFFRAEVGVDDVALVEELGEMENF